MAYLLFVLLKVLEGILWIVGIPLVFIAYPLRRYIDKYPTLFKYLILYWFINSDESSYEDNWYGVYELVEDDLDNEGNIIKDKYTKFSEMGAWSKFVLYLKWVIKRNPHWNLKLVLGKISGGALIPSSVKQLGELIGEAPNTTWRNKTIFGRQSIRYKVEGKSMLFFRYSFSREIKKWSPLPLLGLIFNRGQKYRFINVMLGYGSNSSHSSGGRVISKLRIWS